jgi:hypothetical protein
MPPVVQSAHPIGGPGNDMWHARCDLLLTAGAPEGPLRARTTDPTHEPFTVAVELPSLDPTDGSLQIKPGVLTASAVGSGHAPIVAGAGRCGS